MGQRSELANLLHSVGQKATPQRLAILSVLRDTHGHLTAMQILNAARPAHAAIDQSTVYRTLVSAEQSGLIRRFMRGSDEVEFEWAHESGHHHLICDNCGGFSTLDESGLSELMQDVLDRTGFLVNAQHLALQGTCAACRQTA